MIALFLWQPHAQASAAGLKPYETRQSVGEVSRADCLKCWRVRLRGAGMSSPRRPARNNRSKGPEAIVQDTILDYLAATHTKAFRMNTGQMLHIDEHTGKRRVTRFGVKGMADILAFPKLHGQSFPLWIEVKSQAGAPTPFQESFAEDVRLDGHLYLVARSLDDVVLTLATLNQRTPPQKTGTSKNLAH